MEAAATDQVEVTRPRRLLPVLSLVGLAIAWCVALVPGSGSDDESGMTTWWRLPTVEIGASPTASLLDAISVKAGQVDPESVFGEALREMNASHVGRSGPFWTRDAYHHTITTLGVPLDLDLDDTSTRRAYDETCRRDDGCTGVVVMVSDRTVEGWRTDGGAAYPVEAVLVPIDDDGRVTGEVGQHSVMLFAEMNRAIARDIEDHGTGDGYGIVGPRVGEVFVRMESRRVLGAPDA